MTKVKRSQGASKRNGNNAAKHGSVHKKKKQLKYKNTPTGKVALINSNEKPQNGNKELQNIEKSPQNSAKSSQGNGKNVQNRKTPQKSPKNGKSPSKKSPNVSIKVEEEEDDSSSDINEGVSVNEIFSGQEYDVDSSSSDDDDVEMPDIFGTSLAEETDDDDDEFAEKENKGIRMFTGLKKEKIEESSEEEDEDEEDENDDTDEEENDKKNVLGLESLLGASIADDSDDEDFESGEESNDSEDISDDDEEDEKIASVNSSVVSSGTENDESDDDDEDEEEEDDDDDNDESDEDIGQLLGDTIPDDDDDADFDEEQEDDEDEDEETSDDETKNESFDSAKSGDEKNRTMTRGEKEEREKRTIFIGNVPKEAKMSKIESEFKKFGPIDSIRIRGIIPKNLKTPLKVAAIKKEFHPKSKTICVFITFKSIESAKKALSMNGKQFMGNHLRVDVATYDKKREEDTKKTVFLGNLPFTVEDNEIWEMFKDCGHIDSVRVIRDRQTGLGRGFGYINFKTTDGAVLALNLNGVSIQNRELRVKVDTLNAPKKNQGEKHKKRKLVLENESGSPKKFKTENSESTKTATRNSINAERRMDKKHSRGEKQRVKSDPSSPQNQNAGQFQGQKADSKKTFKPDKTAKKKKQMAAKLLAKSKKPSED